MHTVEALELAYFKNTLLQWDRLFSTYIYWINIFWSQKAQTNEPWIKW